MHDALAKAAAQVGPPAGVSGLVLAGVTLPDWVLIVTLALGVVNLFVIVRDKIVRPWMRKDRREHQEGSE